MMFMLCYTQTRKQKGCIGSEIESTSLKRIEQFPKGDLSQKSERLSRRQISIRDLGVAVDDQESPAPEHYSRLGWCGMAELRLTS